MAKIERYEHVHGHRRVDAIAAAIVASGGKMVRASSSTVAAFELDGYSRSALDFRADLGDPSSSHWSRGAGNVRRPLRARPPREPGLASSSCRRVARARLPSAGTPGISL